MDFAHIRNYTNKHCRFKLRSGKEVFGVIWEVETAEQRQEGASQGGVMKRLYFASIRDYERFKDEGTPVHVIPMTPDEIVLAESIAS